MTALVRPPMKPINTAEAASRLVFQYDDLGTVGGLHIAADLSRDLGPDFPGPWSSRFSGPLSSHFVALVLSVPRTLFPYWALPKSLRWHRRHASMHREPGCWHHMRN